MSSCVLFVVLYVTGELYITDVYGNVSHRCPIAGCSNLRVITMDDLKENKMLKRIIAEKKAADKKQAKPRSHKN